MGMPVQRSEKNNAEKKIKKKTPTNSQIAVHAIAKFECRASGDEHAHVVQIQTGRCAALLDCPLLNSLTPKRKSEKQSMDLTNTAFHLFTACRQNQMVDVDAGHMNLCNKIKGNNHNQTSHLGGINSSWWNNFFHLSNDDTSSSGHWLREIVGSSSKHKIAHFVGFPGFDERHVASNRLFHHVAAASKLAHLFGVAHQIGFSGCAVTHRQSSQLKQRVHSCCREKGRNSCSSCSNLLRQSSLCQSHEKSSSCSF